MSELRAIHCLSTGEIFVLSNAPALYCYMDGEWTADDLFVDDLPSFSSYFPGRNALWASSRWDIMVPFKAGVLRRGYYGEWENIQTSLGSDLTCVTGIDHDCIWCGAVGGGVTYWDGSTWATQTTSLSGDITDIHAASRDTVFAVTADGEVGIGLVGFWFTVTTDATVEFTSIWGHHPWEFFAIGNRTGTGDPVLLRMTPYTTEEITPEALLQMGATATSLHGIDISGGEAGALIKGIFHGTGSHTTVEEFNFHWIAPSSGGPPFNNHGLLEFSFSDTVAGEFDAADEEFEDFEEEWLDNETAVPSFASAIVTEGTFNSGADTADGYESGWRNDGAVFDPQYVTRVTAEFDTTPQEFEDFEEEWTAGVLEGF